ncbi:hypothetical protein CKO28_13760 [Rhodovibrio sodomensis]|uniref:DUF4314 domain-containing protein n=1 Tax=Rhodovibrio sodomensis TaxID=1088 RepID=A0ABS1DF59_9PROT|nr:DUF4314 domain-containing protein [Rhodovibrio sodomensis]MBK1669100.1 hypothetical protein [Rhodovibrio sodomensis]
MTQTPSQPGPTDLAVGDRIELIEMPDDPSPVAPGTQGTVTRIQPLWDHRIQLGVDWDSGRSLMLILPKDQYRKLASPTTSS